MGPVTKRFFAVGDEQEATQYEYVDLNGGVLDAPKLEFDSFDKVPRKRRPLVAVVGILSLLVIGGVARKGGRQVRWVRSWVAAATHARVAAQPMVGHAESVATMPTPTPTPIAAPAVVVVPIATPAAARVAADTQNARAVEEATGEPANVPTRPAHAAAEARDESATDDPRPKRATADSGHTARPKPLRGYVWSPTARALVPAGDSPGESQPGVNATPAPEPNAAPAETSPPPVDQAQRPTDPAPIAR